MNLLFYIFSSFALVSGIMVIEAKNPVHSVLFLILVFFNCAGLLLLLGLDFFALIFLVVYVGAIAVLFLFVVMMLNIKLAEINEKRLRYLPIGGVLGFLFLLLIFLIVDNDLIPLLPNQETIFFAKGNNDNFFAFGDSNSSSSLHAVTQSHMKNDLLYSYNLSFIQWSHLLNTYSNIEAIGLYIYTYYFVFFLLASLILLVAMIGAIVLTMSKGVSIKRQKVFQQNTREFAETVSRFS